MDFPKMYNLPYQSLKFLKIISSRKVNMDHYDYVFEYSVVGTAYTSKYLAVKGLKGIPKASKYF